MAEDKENIYLTTPIYYPSGNTVVMPIQLWPTMLSSYKKLQRFDTS